MKRILIGVLLIILGMSYFVTREHILKELSAPITERMRPAEVVEIKQVNKPRQEVELMAYPAPEDTWPYIPPPDYSHETPLPTPDLSILPTPAPTMNPMGD